MNNELTLVRYDDKVIVRSEISKVTVEHYTGNAKKPTKTASVPIDAIVVINKLMEQGYQPERKEPLYPAVKAIQKLLWVNDDIIDQDTLFKVQDKVAKLALDIANAEGKSKQIVKDFPFLYSTKEGA